MNLLLLVNTHSGKGNGGEAAQKIIQHLEPKGWTIAIEESLHKDYFVDFLIKNKLENIDVIGVVGGDGTMFEVLNGLIKGNQNLEIPIILFPLGTGNAFNHDVGCLNLTEALRRIEHPKTQKIDIIRLKYYDKILYAYNIVGYGLVADINITSEKLRWMGGLRYSVAALWHIFKNPKFEAKIEIDDIRFEGQFCFLLASNTIHTGKAMKMSPLAVLTDGLLDVIVVKHLPFWKLLQVFPLIYSGKHIHSPLLRYIHATKIKIEAAPQTLIVDGESYAKSSVVIDILPSLVTMVVG